MQNISTTGINAPVKDEDGIILSENNYYWLNINGTFILIKIVSINAPKEIVYKEVDILLEDNKIIISDKEDVIKKMTYPEKINLTIFNITQLDSQKEDLTLIPNITYASVLNNIKFKFLKNISFIKAGKITLGINLTGNSFSNYEDFSEKNLLFNFERNNNYSFIINGVPHSGKSTLNRNVISKILRHGLGNQNIYLNNNGKNNEMNKVNEENSQSFKKLGFCIENNNYELFCIIEKITLYLEFINFFGNCVENNFRYDSSRYMRVTKFYFDNKTIDDKPNNFISKIKFKHYLLEKARILQDNNFHFHIFHCTINGLAGLFSNENYQKRLMNFFPEYTKNLIENYQDYKHFIIQCSLTYEDIYFSDFVSLYYEEKFFCFLKIFQDISFHKKLLIKILNLIMIIILLKSLEYSEDEDGNAILNQESSEFKMILNLMSLETEDEKILLTKKLVSREISSPSGSFYVIKFKLEEAYRIKENFVKFIYENLFDYICKFSNMMINDQLEKINHPTKDQNKNDEVEDLKKDENTLSNKEKELNSKKSSSKNTDKINEGNFVQIIECFGFENSPDAKNNSLENLFINYANDKLNNLFFDQLIKTELSLYESEGVSDNDLKKNFGDKFTENNNDKAIPIPKDTNSTITRRGTVTQKKPLSKNSLADFDVNKTIGVVENESRGLFKLLDEVTFLISNNKGIINSFIDKIKNNWNDVDTTSNTFYLQHFGSIVEYGAPDFIFKNQENLSNELKFITKNVFKNLFGLTIKNFKMNKEKTLKYLMKKFNEENLEDISNFGNNNIKTSGARLSVTRRISRNMIKSKTNSEKFITDFKKLLNKIRNTNLKIIKLINTSIPFIPSEEDYIRKTDFINYDEFNGRLLDYYLYPFGKNIFEIFGKEQYSSLLSKYNGNNKESDINIDNFFSYLNIDELESLVVKYDYKFDDKYVLKQIYSSGILESILLAKSGFFIRCDYKTLAKKLFIFKNFFKIKKDKEDDNKKMDFIDIENNNQTLSENWVPDEEFIKKIAYLTKIDESDFIFGKSLLFISNRALQKNPNLISCVEFPKLIIKNLFKNAVKKVRNLKLVENDFKFILKKRKITAINQSVECMMDKLNKRIFLDLLKQKIEKFNKAAKKIQIKFKHFTEIKCKIIKLQKFSKIFFEKLKNFKKRKTFINFLKLFEKIEKQNIYTGIKNIKQFADFKNEKGAFINKKIKYFLRYKRVKEVSKKIFLFLDFQIFNRKNKQKGLYYIDEFFKNVKNLVKIQNLIKRRNSFKIMNILRVERNLQRRKMSAEKIFEFLEIKLNKKLRKFNDQLKSFAKLKNSSTIKIQTNFLKFFHVKKTKILINKKKAFENFCRLIYIKRKNLLIHCINLIKNRFEEIKLIQNESVIKLQSLFRVRKSIKTVKTIKELRDREILLNKFNDLSEKLENFSSLFRKNYKKDLLSKMIAIKKEHLLIENKNRSAIMIQNLIRVKISLNKLGEARKRKEKIHNLTEKFFNLIKKNHEKNFKLRFFENLVIQNNYIILINKNARKIQNLIRIKIANRKLKIKKEIRKKEIEILTEKINKFIYTINKSSELNKKRRIFYRFYKFVDWKIKENLSLILIQNQTRKFFAKRKLTELINEKKIKIKKIRSFFEYLHKKFNENLKAILAQLMNIMIDLGMKRNLKCNKIQLLLKRNMSFIKYRKLIDEKRIEEGKKINSINAGCSIIDIFYNKYFIQERYENFFSNFKKNNSFIKKLDKFMNKMKNIEMEKLKKLLNNSLVEIKKLAKLNRVFMNSCLRKIIKKYRDYIIIRNLKINESRKKKFIEDTDCLLNISSNIYNKNLHSIKKQFFDFTKKKSSNIKKVIKIQMNLKKFLSQRNLEKIKKIKLQKFTNNICRIIENILSNNILKCKYESIKILYICYNNIIKIILIQKNVLRMLSLKKIREFIKKKLQLENATKKLINTSIKIINNYHLLTKKYSFEIINKGIDRHKKIRKIQYNTLRFLSLKKFKILKFEKNLKNFINVTFLISDKNKSKIKKEVIGLLISRKILVDNVLLIQRNIKIFLSMKKLKELKDQKIKLNINTKNIIQLTEKIINNVRNTNRNHFISNLKNFIYNIVKITKIQTCFLIYKSKLKLKELRKEKNSQIAIYKENSARKFLKVVEEKFNSKNLFNKKAKLIDFLIYEHNKFNSYLFMIKQRMSIIKIKDFIRNAQYKNQQKIIKKKNLEILLKKSVEKNTQNSKIIRQYFNLYKKKVIMLKIVSEFVYKIRKNLTNNRYLKKTYLRKFSDYCINKITAKNILKKIYFKPYAKICRSKLKKELINSTTEFSKLFNSLNRSKECKVETTQDTFSVIFSNVNLIDDYLGNLDDNNSGPRMSAAHLSRPNLEKKNEFFDEKKENKENIRLTTIVNPLANKTPINNKPVIKVKEDINNISNNKYLRGDSKIKTKNNDKILKEKNVSISNKKINSKSPVPKIKSEKFESNKKLANIPKVPIATKNNSNTNSNIANSKNKEDNKNNENEKSDRIILEKDLNFSSNEINLNLETKITSGKSINIVNNLSNTRKSITNFKQNNNKNIRNYLNNDKKLQTELDSITNELNELLKDANDTTTSANKLQNNIRNVNLNNSSKSNNSNQEEKGVDYWKLNQQHKRNQLKKIENPLDTNFRNVVNDNTDTNNILNSFDDDQNNVIKEENYEKLAFKRVCLSDYPKTKK